MSNGFQAAILPNAERQFFNQNGEFLAGGLVYMYVPQTTTPKTTWVDQGQTTANTNPIILDSLGRCIIWGSGTYRQVVTDSLGNLVWDQLTSDGGLSVLVSDINAIQGEINTINSEITTIQNELLAQPTWFKRTLAPSSTTYIASVTDSATLFESNQAGGALTIQLPNITSVSTGWFCGILRSGNNVSLTVNGSHGEVILSPNGMHLTTVSTAADDNEFLIVSFHGDFIVLDASPATWAILGASPGISIPNSPLLGGNGASLLPVAVGTGLMLSSGILSATGAAKGVPNAQGIGASAVVTIQSTVLLAIAVAGGAGGSLTFGGGSGAGGWQIITPVTPGLTLTITIGAAGPANSAGGDTIIASGTQGISTIHYGGGQPGGGGGTVISAPYNGLGSTGGQGTQVAFIGSSSSIAAGGPAGWLGSYGNGGQAGNPAGPSPGIQGAVLLVWIQ